MWLKAFEVNVVNNF